MKMARVLAIALIIAMIMTIVGCGNIQNGGNSNDVNGDNNQVGNINGGNGNENIGPGTDDEDATYQEEDLLNLVDEEYVPSEENLIGVAIYPISVADKKYAYNVGDLIPIEEAGLWKAIYVSYFVDDEGNGGNLFEGNTSMWKWSDEEQKFYGEYESATEFLYIGYVYELYERIYILTTHDLVNFNDDGVSVMSVTTIRTDSNGDNVSFDFTITQKN